MHLDLTGPHADNAYKILSGLVTPRPIALVTSSGEDGTVNAAPFSFFNVFGASPPIVGFAPGDRAPGVPKDTVLNIRSSGEFIVHLVDEALAEQAVACAASLPRGKSEIDANGLTTVPGISVNAPRITEAPAALECREWGTLQIGENRLIIGQVLHVHTREGVLDPATLRINGDAYAPVGRTHGPDGYCTTRDQFKITRPE